MALSAARMMSQTAAMAQPKPKARPPGQQPDALELRRRNDVVFNCYGDRRFLSQVWVAGKDLGRELLKSPSEKQLAKRPTGHDVAVLTVKSRS